MKKLHRTVGVSGVAFGLALAAVLAAPVGAQTAFTSQMDLGARGTQVTALQQYLATDSTVYPSGLITGYFGNLTRQAVINFQVKNGISAVGRVGPQTLAKLNELSGGMTGADMSAADIYNVNVSTVNPTMATVSFNSNENVSAKLFVSASPLVMNEAEANFTEPYISGQSVIDLNAARSTSPLVTVTGLTPGTTYYYVVLAKDVSGNVSVTRPSTFIAR